MFTQTFTLPGGYVDEHGVTQRQVELSPVTGFEEEYLANVGPAVCSASVVTGLLARCIQRVGTLEPVTTSLVTDLLVGDRDFLMLKLREITCGNKLDAVLFCPDPECGKPMDVTLNLDDFAPEMKPVSDRLFTLELPADEGETGSFSIEFRLPTGADQETAAPWISGDEESAVCQLLARTITRVNDETAVDQETVRALPPKVRIEIEERMEKLAPHVTIELETSCVECRKPFTTLVDLTSFFLAEMKQSRQSLEREFHFLAWHYHWRESEILALTRKKRRRYIELIQEELLGAGMLGSRAA